MRQVAPLSVITAALGAASSKLAAIGAARTMEA